MEDTPTYTPLERINARVDRKLAEKLEALQRATGRTTTQVLRDAIELAYEHHVKSDSGRLARHAFESAGLIGCAEGPVDLAENAKAYLTDELTTKTRARRGTR